MNPIPVIAIFDIGKTNKKLLLFDTHYAVVYEKTSRLPQTTDEDGEACEDIDELRRFVFQSLTDIFNQKEFDIRAINFSAYGASLVYIDQKRNVLTPLYNYLKIYPAGLQKKFYDSHGGQPQIALQTASPALGSLNSGLQLYRLKYEQPGIFRQIRYALHLPQWLAWLVSGRAVAEITSIGCHTALWDFEKGTYHQWVAIEGILEKMAPLVPTGPVSAAVFEGHSFIAGSGVHDSSAALVPYLTNITEPFMLISTGTWCISLNPFNESPLSLEELKKDVLCYFSYRGKPVKAARIFAGHEHEVEVERIAGYFNLQSNFYNSILLDPGFISKLRVKNGDERHWLEGSLANRFSRRDLAQFSSGEEAYHQLMMDIIRQQIVSTKIVEQPSGVKNLFVDGGFCNNDLYMRLLASSFPELKVMAASMTEASALGAALLMHDSWNPGSIPQNLVTWKYYPHVI